MPGMLPHLLAGSIMAIIGRYYYKDYFKGEEERALLIGACLIFSVVPDIFLGLFYLYNLPFDTMLSYHILLHAIFIPISLFFLIILKLYVDVKYEPIIVMSFWCIVLHILMDAFIAETGIFI